MSVVEEYSEMSERRHPTIWGLDPTQLHDRFWASRGVQVVRQGERSTIVEDAELYLLTDRNTLSIFRLVEVVERMSWVQPDLLMIRLRNRREIGYREQVVWKENGEFLRYQRSYGQVDTRMSRVAFTSDRNIARLWQSLGDDRNGWRKLRRQIKEHFRDTMVLSATMFYRQDDEEVSSFMRELIQTWKDPDTTIAHVERLSAGVWCYEGMKEGNKTKFIGPAWIGAGRSLEKETGVLGPAAIWDDPAHRPMIHVLEWAEIEPAETFHRKVRPRKQSSFYQISKRFFDIIFALIGIILTLPIYPFVILAIWLEDGRPFFFAHTRETRGGKEFGCLKFRSMRKDADQIKKQLQAANQADGPQFFMEDDPRLTRVGRILRKLNLDEIPQFWNVLAGDMSIIGPRPSPFGENQYCPPWREARLSVRPGITGLWQVNRTRRAGHDFQEWIKFDIEYVENAGWRMDIRILYETVRVIIRGIISS